MTQHPPFASSGALKDLPHGFFGREGGVSTGLYASLNCGPGSGDDPADVAENRNRVAAALGFTSEKLFTLHQHHSADCLILDGSENAGERPKADAFATDRPGLLLGILTADCTPALFADHDKGIIGAAHAGWRGATGGVLDSTIEAMCTLGANPNTISAAIGPTIGPDHYEVGEDFVAAVTKADANADRFVIDGQPRPNFDLPGYVADRLARLGIVSVDQSQAHSTYGAPDRYFSYRYNTHQHVSDYGRMIAVIGLPANGLKE